MSVTLARRIAFDVLRRVETEGAFAAELLHARLGAAGDRGRAPLKREDAALATELTLGVLRRLRLLDFLLERHLSEPVASLDLEVLLALRLGLYQLRWLERVPARAAVHESVELVKRAKKRSAASLVNAVLRRAAESAGTPAEKLVPRELPPAERLGILHSHPAWMVERWLARFGEARTVALMEANNRAPRVTCAVLEPARQSEIITGLEGAGLEVEPGRWLRAAVTVRGGNLAGTEAFRRGRVSIQDEASQMVALLVDARAGDSVLDLCAAPGGKTALLARTAGPAALLVAADLHPHRLRAMQAQLARVGVAHARLVALDAATPLPFARRFERILVDAPCSGTGTLERNPEIRWRLRPDDLADLHGRQVAMLAHALELLAPGGRLVYSTCSLEPEENESVVTEAHRNRRDICLLSGEEALAPHLAEGISPKNFFAAILERR